MRGVVGRGTEELWVAPGAVGQTGNGVGGALQEPVSHTGNGTGVLKGILNQTPRVCYTYY